MIQRKMEFLAFNLVDPGVRLGGTPGAAVLTAALRLATMSLFADRHCGVNDRVAGVGVRVFTSSLTMNSSHGD